MKVESENDFKPVTITLETQDELNYFTSLFYRCGGTEAVRLFGSSSYLQNMMEKQGGQVQHIGCDGNVHINTIVK